MLPKLTEQTVLASTMTNFMLSRTATGTEYVTSWTRIRWFCNRQPTQKTICR